MTISHVSLLMSALCFPFSHAFYFIYLNKLQSISPTSDACSPQDLRYILVILYCSSLLIQAQTNIVKGIVIIHYIDACSPQDLRLIL